MIKTIKYLFFILLISLESCNNKKVIINQEKSKIQNDIINQKSKFIGHWFYESNKKDSIDNNTFEINLYNLSDNKLNGNYCSISRNGSKIDCFNDDEINIFGELKNDTIYLTFKSNWENSKGSAILYLIGDNLFWKITKKEGVFYLPSDIKLSKD